MPGGWSDVELDGLIEEIIVDAYGDDEQLGSFECVFGDADLPVAAETLGLACTLLEVVYKGDDRRGLRARLRLDGREVETGLLDVTITDVKSDTARILAAFRRGLDVHR